MATKQAIVIGVSLEVACPHCGEAQPDPDVGNGVWTPDQVRGKNGHRRTCVSCDAQFTIHFSNRVTVQ